MERIVHALLQGTTDWDQFRLKHFGASEIAAVLGLSKNTTRTELLRIKATGLAKEFGDWLQRNVLDKGHEIEERARPLAVAFAGVDGFYPATVSIGRISASSDGIDMLDETAWECKSLNKENGPIVRAGNVPEEHMPQCQQVLMVTGADRLLFTVSDGTRENTFHTWVEPDTAWFDRIRAAWKQFEVDLAEWKPEAAAEPTPIGRTPESLPALFIEVSGQVTNSNLDAYKAHALAVFGSINRRLVTDQDFEDASKAVRWCGDVEDRLAAAKQHALSQTASIDALFRTIDDISAEARRVRLDLDRLVKARKESRRTEILGDHIAALGMHMDKLRKRVGPYMPLIPADFAGAVRGLKTFASMIDKCGVELARAKVAANEVADKISTNATWLRDNAGGYEFLFPDQAGMLQMAVDQFAVVAKARITEHKAAEQRRADALAEAAREKIRKEEAARLEREAAERKRKEEEEAAQARAEQEAADRRAAAAAQPAPVVAEPGPAPAAAPVHQADQPAPAANVVAMPARAPVAQPAASTPPTLKLGQIGERLGLGITAERLKALGFEGTRDRAALLFHESDFGLICAALIEHIQAVQAKQAA